MSDLMNRDIHERLVIKFRIKLNSPSFGIRHAPTARIPFARNPDLAHYRTNSRGRYLKSAAPRRRFSDFGEI